MWAAATNRRAATTGRASKQLSASTGRQAATVHRHLGLGPRQEESEPVDESVLIIDESSMIDLWLMDEIVARLYADYCQNAGLDPPPKSRPARK